MAPTGSSCTHPYRPTPRTKPLRVRATPPPRQSFPLPSQDFFTGSLFDSLVIFLQKYSIEWTDIQCVARGTHPDEAVPTICIFVTSPEDINEVVRLWEEQCRGNVKAFSSHGGEAASNVNGTASGSGSGNGGGVLMGNLEEMVPDEVVEVEFARVFPDLAVDGHGAGISGRDVGPGFAGGSSGVFGGFLGTGAMGASIASLVAASMKSAANRSDLSLACTCPPSSLLTKSESGDNEGIGSESDDDYGCESIEDEVENKEEITTAHEHRGPIA